MLQIKGKVQGTTWYPPRNRDLFRPAGGSIESETSDSQLLKDVSRRKTIERSQLERE